MKKILFAFTMLLAMTACTSHSTEMTKSNEESSEVDFEVAKSWLAPK